MGENGSKNAVRFQKTISFGDRSYTIDPVVRSLIRGEEVRAEETDENGFLRPSDSRPEIPLVSMEACLRSPDVGGIIVGAGDSGKSWFLEALAARAANAPSGRAKLLRLRNYPPRARELIADCTDFRAACDASGVAGVLLIDGLDENEESCGILTEIARNLLVPGRFRMYVTSRPRSVVTRLTAESPLKALYHLAPFSFGDACELFGKLGIDRDAMEELCGKNNLWPLVSNPGSAVLLAGLAHGGSVRAVGSNEELLTTILTKLLNEARDGMEPTEAQMTHPGATLLDVAGWIATRVFLAGKDSVWVGGAHNCPPQALHWLDLVLGRFDQARIQVTLTRRLFEPLAQERLRFQSDGLTVPFLIAHWLIARRHTGTPLEQILNVQPPVGEKTGRLLRWIARARPRRAAAWLGLAPEYFLDCETSIRSFGIARYYDALESAFRRVARSDRLWTMRAFAPTMRGQTVLRAPALQRLAADCDGGAALLAINLLMLTQSDNGAPDAICDYLNRNAARLATDQLACILVDLKHQKRRFAPEQLARLTPLLDRLTPTDWNLRGNLLILLWPTALSAKDLTTYLLRPPFERNTEAYRALIHAIENTLLEPDVDHAELLVLLDWADRNRSDEYDEDDDIDELAQAIISRAFDFCEDPLFTPLLARILEVDATTEAVCAPLKRMCLGPYEPTEEENAEWAQSRAASSAEHAAAEPIAPALDDPFAAPTDTRLCDATDEAGDWLPKERAIFENPEGTINQLLARSRADPVEAKSWWIDTTTFLDVRASRRLEMALSRVDVPQAAELLIWFVNQGLNPTWGEGIAGGATTLDLLMDGWRRLLLNLPRQETIDLLDAALARQPNAELADLRTGVATRLRERTPIGEGDLDALDDLVRDEETNPAARPAAAGASPKRKGPSQRHVRKEPATLVANLAQRFHIFLTAMTTMRYEEWLEARKSYMTGKALAALVQGRAGTIGKLISFKGKAEHPNEMLQTLWLFCVADRVSFRADDNAFTLFRRVMRTWDKPVKAMTPEELYRRLSACIQRDER